ncbi:MAG TPA: response regulator transcription factor [Candidatus Elarobacter sp.]|jgi:DNA-binding NarL/FixJ family response regulator
MAEPSKLRVMLADDHPVVREGLKALINAQPDMFVVGEADNGEAACEAAAQLQPDILVLDLSMPAHGGAEASERMRRELPQVKVLVLTVHEERVYLTRLLRAGVSGYVLKRAAPTELVNALRVVASGAVYVDPAVAGTLVEGFLDAEAFPDRGPHVALSDREQAVLVRIARGFSNKEIASALSISVKTVESYKARVVEKLGFRSRVDIVRYAARHGWL